MNGALRGLLGLLLAAGAVSTAYVTSVPAPTAQVTRGPQSWRVPLGEARSASLRLEAQDAEVRVTTDAPPSALLVARTELRPGASDIRSHENDGAHAVVTYVLHDQRRRSLLSLPPSGDPSRLHLRLNPHVPLRLQLHGSVGEQHLDLRDATARELKLAGNVGGLHVTLPARGRYTASIDHAVGDLRVRLPASLGARVRVRHDVGSVDARGLERQGNVYTTPGFETAGNRVELSIDADVGDVRLEVLGE